MRSLWNKFLCFIGVHKMEKNGWFVPHDEIEDDSDFSFIEYEINYCKRCDTKKERFKIYDKSRNAKRVHG